MAEGANALAIFGRLGDAAAQRSAAAEDGGFSPEGVSVSTSWVLA
jgi:hypothetical protein